MDLLKQALEQAKLIFNQMTKTQKTSIGLVAASMLICLIAVFSWSSKPSYAVLYSSLSPADAGQIQSRLLDLKVDFKIQGSTITVPTKDVYSTRITLANEGLPTTSGVGFEMFDKTRVGQTDYLQRLNYKRALEGELVRTITALEDIDSCRIHLVMPKPSIFEEDQEPTTASIILTLKSGKKLDKASVSSITHLVSTSVEGLNTNHITIVDSSGSLLSTPTDDSQMTSMLAARHIEIERNVESYLEQKASSLLFGLLGPNKSIVRVSINLDFSQSETTAESYRPEEQVVRSENRIEESVKTGEEGANNASEKSITNYEIGRTVKHMIGATGSVTRVSVAVALDGTYEFIEDEDGVGRRKYKPRPAEELDSIKKLIVNTIGLNEKRGDNIEVTNIAFDTSHAEEQALKEKEYLRKQQIMGVVDQWPWLLLVIVIFILSKTSKKIMATASEMKVILPRVMTRGMEASIPPGVLMAGDAKKAKEDKERDLQELIGPGLKLPKTTKLESEIIELASQNPETIARIVRKWLGETA